MIKDLKIVGWQVFAVSFAAAFLMVVLPHLGVKKVLVSPTAKALTQPDLLTPKLQVRPNNFVLKSDNKFNLTVNITGNLNAFSVLDFNSGQVVISKNSDARLPIASLTKLMSAVVALDFLDPGQTLIASKQAAEVEPTRMGVVEGERLMVSELLNALLLTSSNDAAQMLKEGVDAAYGQGSFVAAMNKKAYLIGLKNSHFSNPQGYDSSLNYSSTSDLAVLAGYVLSEYPLIAQIVKKDYQFYPATQNHKQIDLYNWNGLLGVYPGIEGVKIGNTDAAGTTMIVLSEREGHKILVVELGADNVLERDLNAGQLLDLGFSKSYRLNPVNMTEGQLKAKYATWKYWN